MRNFQKKFLRVFDFGFFWLFPGGFHGLDFFIDFAKSMTFHRGISQNWDEFVTNNFSRMKSGLWRTHRRNLVKNYFRIWEIYFSENHSWGGLKKRGTGGKVWLFTEVYLRIETSLLQTIFHEWNLDCREHTAEVWLKTIFASGRSIFLKTTPEEV